MATSTASLSPRASRKASGSEIRLGRQAGVAPAPVLSNTGIRGTRSPSGTSVAVVAVHQAQAHAPRVVDPLGQHNLAMVPSTGLEGTPVPARAARRRPPVNQEGRLDPRTLTWLEHVNHQHGHTVPVPPPIAIPTIQASDHNGSPLSSSPTNSTTSTTSLTQDQLLLERYDSDSQIPPSRFSLDYDRSRPESSESSTNSLTAGSTRIITTQLDHSNHHDDFCPLSGPISNLDHLQADLHRYASFCLPMCAIKYDLQGDCLSFLTPDTNLTIPPRISLLLTNGSLDLKDQSVIHVQRDARLQMESVNVRGSGRDHMGLVTISCSDACGVLNHCNISVTYPPSAWGTNPELRTSHAVYVTNKGCAQLRGCTLSSVTGYGLYVEGCEARATDCKAEHCHLDGYAVAGPASAYLGLYKCTAARNSGSGFSATGASAMLDCDGTCISHSNQKDGFRASGTAQAFIRDTAIAHQNKESGFAAGGDGSYLEVAAKSVSYSNGGHGFLAEEAGQVVVRNECTAAGNGSTGFSSQGAGSQLATGAGCTAAGNKGCGYDTNGGFLSAGKNSRALHNVAHGFRSRGQGARLEAGRGCTAHHNSGGGYLALGASNMQIGKGCTASDNAMSGFEVRHPDSEVQLGEGCKAVDNELCGFKAHEGGRMVVGSRAQADGNLRGYSSTGDAVMGLMKGCRGSGNSDCYKYAVGGLLMER